jgi:hypothetical protein
MVTNLKILEKWLKNNIKMVINIKPNYLFKKKKRGRMDQVL